MNKSYAGIPDQARDGGEGSAAAAFGGDPTHARLLSQRERIWVKAKKLHYYRQKWCAGRRNGKGLSERRDSMSGGRDE